MANQSTLKQYGMYAVGVLWIVRQWTQGSNEARTVAKKKGDKDGAQRKVRPGLLQNKDTLYMLKIVFTNWKSNEAMLFYAFTTVLLFRTWLSLVVADIDGFMVKQLINRKKDQVVTGIMMWLAIALPSSLINALIKYLQARLALSVREKLTAYLRELYFTNENYFRISHLDKTIANPEHALTEDVAQWSERLTDLLSGLGKPLVDITFFSAVLFKNLGFANQFLASVLVWESGKLLKKVRPNYAKMVQERGSLEAKLRLQHNRVITASEEIAFSSGDAREKNILKDHFDRIVDFTKKRLFNQIFYHTAEDFITKYVWNVVGMIQIAVPLIQRGGTAGNNAKYFITLRRMMIRNGDATERVMAGIKEMNEFGGFTQRVMDMVRCFEEQSKKKNQILGEVHHSEEVIVKDLPIVTPINDTLIDTISFNLVPGDRLLILGPNGCGKSSLFRILCGLWPQLGGSISKPANKQDLYFIPQKPYLVQGKFRDQIIYPQTEGEMKANGRTDQELTEIMEKVLMGQVLQVHGGLDGEKEWAEVLSGGEKQRLGLARVFYHKPKYAILDEVSSAINLEAEQEIFSHLIKEDMSLITISHRHSLFRFHNKLLTFDGEGNWEFNEHLHQSQLQSMSEQKSALMRQLSGVCKTLGEDWPKSYTPGQ